MLRSPRLGVLGLLRPGACSRKTTSAAAPRRSTSSGESAAGTTGPSPRAGALDPSRVLAPMVGVGVLLAKGETLFFITVSKMSKEIWKMLTLRRGPSNIERTSKEWKILEITRLYRL